MNVSIKENSRWAKWAARKLRAGNMAITFGHTIHLYNTTRLQFLKNISWVRHEVAHVYQYRRYGFFRFIILYIWESLRHGYFHNKLEQEARAAEMDTDILKDVTFL